MASLLAGYPYVWHRRRCVSLLTRAGLVERGTYDIISPSGGLPTCSQQVVIGTFELHSGNTSLPTAYLRCYMTACCWRALLPSPMREKCPICVKICQTLGLSNHLRRCKGPRGVVNPGAKKRLWLGQEALRAPAKIPRGENRQAESRERQEIRDLVNEV